MPLAETSRLAKLLTLIGRAFKSRTALFIALLAAINGVPEFRSFILSLPQGALDLGLLDAVVGVLAIYFRVNPKANFNQ